MERTKSLSEQRDAKRDSASSLSSSSTSAAASSSTVNNSTNSQQQSGGRELHRTPSSSLGLDALYKRWLRPSSSSNAVSCSAVNSNSPQNLPSPSGTPSAQQQHGSQQNFTHQIALDGHESHHYHLDSGRPANTTSTVTRFWWPEHLEYIAGLMHELRSRSVTGTMESRLRILDELAATVRMQPMNEQMYSYILAETKEMLDKAQPNEVRQRVWRLYTQLVHGRAESLGQYRYLLFDLIRVHDGRTEDIPHRIELLIALTDSGRTISYYENNMADFMVSFLSNLIERRTNVNLKVKPLQWEVKKGFLNFITGLIKFNSSHISSDNSQALCLMIQYTCQLAFDSELGAELEKIYEFFNVVLSYGHLPNQFDSLSQVVIVVCIGVSKKDLYNTCRQIMRNLLGTHLGFACLSTLLHIIEDQTNYTELVLIRGAVYFLVQSLWGELYNEKTTLSPNTVLPAFKNLLENELIASHCIISLEIAHGLHIFLMSVINPAKNVTTKQLQRKPSLIGGSILPEELPEAKKIVFEWTWELVLDVCHNLVYFIVNKEQELKEAKALVSMIQLLIEALKELVNKVLSVNDHSGLEKTAMTPNELLSLMLLMSNENFIQKIFEILELGINYLSEQSILKLIAYRLTYISDNLSIIPNRDWLAELNHLMEVFFSRSSLSTNIRVQFLIELQKFLSSNYYSIDPDKFWIEVASKHFSPINQNRCCEVGIHFLLYLVKQLNLPDNLLQIVGIFSNMAFIHMRTLFNRKHSVSHSGSLHSRSNAHQQITHQNSAPNQSDASDSLNDLVHLVEGLVSIYREKIDHQHCHSIAVMTFGKVMEFYEEFLQAVKSSELELNASRIRFVSRIKCTVVSMILSLRSNSLGQLGVVIDQPTQGFIYSSPQSAFNRSLSHEEKIKYSSYVLLPDFLLVESSFQHDYMKSRSCEPQTYKTPPGVLLQNHFYQALFMILNYIRTETDWAVLETIFEKLAKLLKNKGLITAIFTDRFFSAPNDLRPGDQSFPDLLIPVLEKFIDSLNTRLSDLESGEIRLSKADVLACVFKSISELVSYPLQPSNQTLLVNKCLRNGLVQFSSKIACIRQCIISLTICSMEMQTTMNKFLKDIIITLSQISSSKTLAVPKLEFLSNIILFPDLYYTFTVKQYLSIFSIATQYVNPYKYGEYTVVLALRVISMWFLKCPSPFRIQLMKFLTKQLSTNILKEVEPATPQLSQRLNSISLSSDHRNRLETRLSVTSSPPPPPSTPVNVFSSQFSFSFHSSNSNFDSHHASSPHPLSSSGSAFNVPTSSSASPMATEGLILDPNNKELSKVELVEVCMDMFSTNAFNTTSPLPLKPSMIDKLLNRQKSQMWLIGHKLVQITTTACSSRAFRNGLCNKCYHICHMNAVEPTEDFSNTPSSAGSQSNIFSDRVTFSSQLSSDQPSKLANCNANSAIASNRRRHRSEINSSNAKKNPQNLFADDDYFMKRRLTTDTSFCSPMTTPTTKSFASTNASDPDLMSSNSNVDNRYCRCWCQNWAEILIRRSTGNTRWIMRVENNLGDFPYWTYSKDADDSLAEIFSHADPEINLALKMQKEAEEEPDSSIEHLNFNLIDKKEPVAADGSVLSKPSQEKALFQCHSTVEAQRQRVSVPVTRAASFGSRRPMMQSNMLEQQTSNSVTPRQMPEPKVLTQAKHEVLERWGRRHLEKDFSVDQDEPPASLLRQPSPQSQAGPSPVYSSGSSEMTVTSPDRNSANFRDRSSTISVMTPVQKSASSTGVNGGSNQAIHDPTKSTSTLNLSSNRPSISSGALSPQAVFLQLYYNSTFKEVSEMSMFDKPIMLDKNDALVRSISCLDRVTPYETHKIGVLYIGPGQVESKLEILSNQMGDFRYTMFVQKLGHIINLEDVDPNVCFLGGLSCKKDGPYAISWGDHLVQAIFHVGTFMPSANNDRNCQSKMLHIGNDFICIVYNNSGEKFDMATIKGDGQFLQAMVVITPLERESNSVQLCAKKEFIEFIGHSDSQIISDHALPVYVRQLALHANLAAMVSHTSRSLKSYNISNWITRLQNIKRVRSRATENLPLYNPEMSHNLRSAVPPQTPHPLSASSPHGRIRFGNGPASQSSRDESDSVISSSLASPNIPGSAGTSSIGTFDYDTGTRLAFPDFTEFTKDPL